MESDPARCVLYRQSCWSNPSVSIPCWGDQSVNGDTVGDCVAAGSISGQIDVFH